MFNIPKPPGLSGKLPDTKTLIMTIIALVICACILIFTLILPYSFLHTSTPSSETPSTICNRTTIQFFYSDTCPHCHNVMPFMKGIQENYTNVDVRYLDISNTTNSNMFVIMNKQRNITSYGVPEVIVGDKVLIGDIEIPEKLETLIKKC